MTLRPSHQIKCRHDRFGLRLQGNDLGNAHDEEPPGAFNGKRRPGLFGKGKKKSLMTLLKELKQLTVDYAKQETIDPLKGVPRFLAAGVAGSVLLGIGLILWIVGILRLVQVETGSRFSGHLTWVPYLITLVFSLLVTLLAVRAIGADGRRTKRKEEARQSARQAEGAR